MAKIRGIKPELWTDESFVELSPFARLLWIGLWNHACDNGHLQDKSKQIKMRILPTDDVNCAELLREIEAQGLIERVDGWIIIPNLPHHQKPHKRWFVVCEKPGCEHPEGTSYGFEKKNPTPKSTVVQPLNNREQPLNNRCSTADGDGDGDGDGDKQPLSDKSDGAVVAIPDRFEDFWNAYDKKVGRKKAEAKYRLALKKPGVNAELLIAAAGEYIDWQRSIGKHPEFTKHPETWLNGEHWNDERSARALSPGRQERRLDAFRAVDEELARREAEQAPTHLRQIGGGL